MNLLKTISTFWHKYSFGSRQPWVLEKKDEAGKKEILDYNHEYIKDLRSRSASFLPPSLSNEEVLKYWVDKYNFDQSKEYTDNGVPSDAVFWNKYSFGAVQPWSIEKKAEDGSISILDYNHAFVKDIRSRLPEELIRTCSDEEVINIWVTRYNYDNVEPKLEVIHAGIDPQGKIRMQFEWNNSFIRQCRENGIQGDTEDDVIGNYLSMVTQDKHYHPEDHNHQQESEFLSEEVEIAKIVEGMKPETLAALERNIIKHQQTRGNR
jgi:hypothetical protein